MSVVAYSIGKSKRSKIFIALKDLKMRLKEDRMPVSQLDLVRMRCLSQTGRMNLSGRKYIKRFTLLQFRMGSRTLLSLNQSTGPGPTAYEIPQRVSSYR